MKDEDEIRKKLNRALYDHFLEEYKGKLSCKPENCVHNYRHEEGGEEVGLCMLGVDSPEEWPGNVCDDVSTAKQCPFFQSKYDKADIEKEFLKKIEEGEDWKDNYPDVAALKWALDGTESEVHPSLWQKTKFYVLSVLVQIQAWLRLV